MKELLRENSGVGAEWVSIRDVEERGNRCWRWAVGLASSVTFPELGRFGGCLFYEILVPDLGTRVEVRAGGRAVASLAAKKDRHVFSGFFEVTGDGPLRLDFSVELAGAGSGQGAERDGATQLPLSFALFKLSFFAYPQVTAADHGRMLATARARRVPDTFCALPFNELYVDARGRSYVCCEAMPFAESDLDMGTQPRSLDQLREAWNGPQHRLTRQAMLLGQRPRGCRRCFEREDKGKPSLRNACTSEQLDLALAAAERIDDHGNLPFPPLGFDVRLGNFCNLKCRMCVPYHSVNLVDDFEELFGHDASEFRSAEWMNGGILGAIAEAAANAQWLTIAGGEPLITPQFTTLLQQFIDRGIAGNVALNLITNLTVLREDTLSLFRRFKEVNLIVSLEGYGEINDYIRYPSKFSVIDKNLRFLHENMTAYNIKSVTFNTSVQVHNVFRLPELFRYLATFPKFHWFPNLSVVTDPDYLSVAILPPAARAQAAGELNAYLAEEMRAWAVGERTSPFFDGEHVRKALAGLLSFLAEAEAPHLVPEFVRVTEFLDKKRGQTAPVKIAGIHFR